MNTRTKPLHLLSMTWFAVCALACVTGGFKLHRESERRARAMEWVRRTANISVAPKSDAPVAAASLPADPVLVARAVRLVDDAIRANRWGAAQARQMRHLLLRLSDADRDAVLDRFGAAVNGRKFKIDTGGERLL